MKKDTLLPAQVAQATSAHAQETVRKQRANHEKMAAALKRNLLRRKGKTIHPPSSQEA